MAFPLISLQYYEFFIEVTLRPISELFVVKNVSDNNNLGKYIKPNFSDPDYFFIDFYKLRQMLNYLMKIILIKEQIGLLMFIY